MRNSTTNWKFWYESMKVFELLFRKLLKKFSITFPIILQYSCEQIQSGEKEKNWYTLCSEISMGFQFYLSEMEEHHVSGTPRWVLVSKHTQNGCCIFISKEQSILQHGTSNQPKRCNVVYIAFVREHVLF